MPLYWKTKPNPPLVSPASFTAALWGKGVKAAAAAHEKAPAARGKLLRKAPSASGVAVIFSKLLIHDLRHTFSITALEHGMDIKTLPGTFCPFPDISACVSASDKM